jgi:hypothetical protein
MQREAERVCDQHPDRFDCPDCLIAYSPKFREYGLIIHDGGRSSIRIRFCPWCGQQFAESLRDRWFEELDLLGIDPGMGEVPEEFQSAAWWSTRKKNTH